MKIGIVHVYDDDKLNCTCTNMHVCDVDKVWKFRKNSYVCMLSTVQIKEKINPPLRFYLDCCRAYLALYLWTP